MQIQINGLPWTEAEEDFIRQISGYIEDGLAQARTLPAEEWELVPVSQRADGLATAIFCAMQNRRHGAPLHSLIDEITLHE